MRARVLTSMGAVTVTAAVALTVAPAALGAWSASNTGSANAKGGRLLATAVSAEPLACQQGNKQDVKATWTAVAGATSYSVQWTVEGIAQPAVTVSALEATFNVTGLNNKTKPVVVTVAAKLHNWTGTTATASTTAGPC